ncbi:hypothetical protein GOQ27_08165 [Clostridium sp. D2Q-11]|uniref:Lipoprotein n=1 Tax=Anaeromonas frigoriresistens TaxID=2683708 RepID=A0A942UZI7_9FIRM|nr:hypothetical protein [Anaeromonas frigoriresistens]MBS4538437.1 hypothetical protein [Anaeromonas frigoriresistens]
MKNKKILLSVLLVMLTLSLMGCTSRSTGLSILSSGDIEKDGMHFKYSYFNGSKEKIFELEEDSEIGINYNIKVVKGTLSIVILDKEELTILEKKFTKDDQGSLSINLEKGQYILKVKSDSSKGKFDVRYVELQ